MATHGVPWRMVAVNKLADILQIGDEEVCRSTGMNVLGKHRCNLLFCSVFLKKNMFTEMCTY